MALALTICFEVKLTQGKEQPGDEKLQDWLLATFGAVFCIQGTQKSGAYLTFFLSPYCTKKKIIFLPIKFCLYFNLKL
jgi:hypothetical protein